MQILIIEGRIYFSPVIGDLLGRLVGIREGGGKPAPGHPGAVPQAGRHGSRGRTGAQGCGGGGVAGGIPG